MLTVDRTTESMLRPKDMLILHVPRLLIFAGITFINHSNRSYTQRYNDGLTKIYFTGTKTLKLIQVCIARYIFMIISHIILSPYFRSRKIYITKRTEHQFLSYSTLLNLYMHCVSLIVKNTILLSVWRRIIIYFVKRSNFFIAELGQTLYYVQGVPTCRILFFMIFFFHDRLANVKFIYF